MPIPVAQLEQQLVQRRDEDFAGAGPPQLLDLLPEHIFLDRGMDGDPAFDFEGITVGP